MKIPTRILHHFKTNVLSLSIAIKPEHLKSTNGATEKRRKRETQRGIGERDGEKREREMERERRIIPTHPHPSPPSANVYTSLPSLPVISQQGRQRVTRGQWCSSFERRR